MLIYNEIVHFIHCLITIHTNHFVLWCPTRWCFHNVRRLVEQQSHHWLISSKISPKRFSTSFRLCSKINQMPCLSSMLRVAGHLLHVQLEQTHHLEGGHDLLLAKLAFLSDLRLCFKQTDWEKSEMCFSK